MAAKKNIKQSIKRMYGGENNGISIMKWRGI